MKRASKRVERAAKRAKRAAKRVRPTARLPDEVLCLVLLALPLQDAAQVVASERGWAAAARLAHASWGRAFGVPRAPRREPPWVAVFLHVAAELPRRFEMSAARALRALQKAVAVRRAAVRASQRAARSDAVSVERHIALAHALLVRARFLRDHPSLEAAEAEAAACFRCGLGVHASQAAVRWDGLTELYRTPTALGRMEIVELTAAAQLSDMHFRAGRSSKALECAQDASQALESYRLLPAAPPESCLDVARALLQCGLRQQARRALQMIGEGALGGPWRAHSAYRAARLRGLCEKSAALLRDAVRLVPRSNMDIEQRAEALAGVHTALARTRPRGSKSALAHRRAAVAAARAFGGLEAFEAATCLAYELMCAGSHARAGAELRRVRPLAERLYGVDGVTPATMSLLEAEGE